MMAFNKFLLLEKEELAPHFLQLELLDVVCDH